MIYLDHAATSFPKPEQVYRGMDAFVRSAGANPGRAGHRLAVDRAWFEPSTAQAIVPGRGNGPNPVRSLRSRSHDGR